MRLHLVTMEVVQLVKLVMATQEEDMEVNTMEVQMVAMEMVEVEIMLVKAQVRNIYELCI